MKRTFENATLTRCVESSGYAEYEESDAMTSFLVLYVRPDKGIFSIFPEI
jgi:hypothetical protein